MARGVVRLAAVALAASGIALVAGHPHVHDHFAYVLPMRAFDLDESYTHAERLVQDYRGTDMAVRMIIPAADGAIRVVYGGPADGGAGRGAFDHVEEFLPGQAVLRGCYEGPDETVLDYWEYLGTSEDGGAVYFDVVHKAGTVTGEMPCDWPAIVRHAKGIGGAGARGT